MLANRGPGRSIERQLGYVNPVASRLGHHFSMEVGWWRTCQHLGARTAKKLVEKACVRFLLGTRRHRSLLRRKLEFARDRSEHGIILVPRLAPGLLMLI